MRGLVFFSLFSAVSFAGNAVSYFPEVCKAVFHAYDAGKGDAKHKRFTKDDVKAEMDANHANLTKPGTIGRMKYGTEWRAVGFRVRDSEIVRRLTDRRRPFNNLDIFIPVKTEEEGEQIYGALYVAACAQSGTRQMLPPMLATIRKIGDTSSNPINLPLPADIPELFGMKEGYVLRISMERAGAVSARDFLLALAVDGELELGQK